MLIKDLVMVSVNYFFTCYFVVFRAYLNNQGLMRFQIRDGCRI
jgi:hypothetical protein